MKEKKYMNFGWKFREKCSMNFDEELKNKDQFIEVDIPHTMKEIPYNYFDQSITWLTSMYQKEIRILPSVLKKNKVLVCEGIAHASYFYIDDKFVASHEGGYDEFRIDLTNYCNELKDYTLTVFVDSHENGNIPPFGNVVDYLGYGGIYRPVYIEYSDNEKLVDVNVKCYNPLENNDLTFEIKTVGGTELNIEIEGNSKDYEIIREDDVYSFTLNNKELWDIDNPRLYQAHIKLYNGYTVVDDTTVTFGIREAKFTSDGFYLNGRKIKLCGLNRHQSYPYVGYAMPKRAQVMDAHILKYDLGVNIVRTSHYMQSTDFLNECDRIGLLVLEEIPGWQHIGGSEFKENTYKNITAMITRDRLHPSIILWGVRINESQDDHDFYKKTNMLAHRLDDTRQTGGIRNFAHSELLEDVYTFNDFSNNGGKIKLNVKKEVTDLKNPYLVTECNGHMFPTKSFDNESRRLEHALRHLDVINASKTIEGLSGVLTWCMNDYNTHKDFGSGDMICYHGVLDMYRNPKLASYVYKSQNELEDVMEVSSSLNIGEYNAGILDPVYIFTNLDYVQIYKETDEKRIFIGKFYPDKTTYGSLAHPPIIVTDFIGDRLVYEHGFSKKDSEIAKKIAISISQSGLRISLLDKLSMLRILKKYHLSLSQAMEMFYSYNMLWGGNQAKIVIEGYKNDKLVKKVVKEEVRETHYEIKYSNTELVVKDTYDIVKVDIRKLDQNDNLLSYSNDVFTISTEGPLEVIGPKSIALIGGQISFWCKTTTNFRKEKYKTTDKVEVDEVKAKIIINSQNNSYEQELLIKLEK